MVDSTEGAGWRRTLRMLMTVVLTTATISAGSGQFTPGPSDEITDDVYPLVFPVAGNHSYENSFAVARPDGRSHEGIDIFADKRTPVVAAADGTVTKVAVGDRSGRYLVVRHDDGWSSYYLHLNNDTPGTDDGLGGAAVEGIEVGAPVRAGDLLDFVGDSGNAEATSPHLHFELHNPGGVVVNPYGHLAATDIDPPRLSLAESGRVGIHSGYEEVNTEFVGHFDPGTGFAADVTAFRDMAFLGTWGRPGLCPNTGIRVFDITDPALPRPVGAFADGRDFPGTAAETLWIDSVETAIFSGDLAVVTLRLCDNAEQGRLRSGSRGLAFYDVTDPTDPVLLSTWDSGDRTQGANDVSVVRTNTGALLVATTVRQSLLHTDGTLGDVRFIDATDPAAPVEISDWDNRRDGPPVARDFDQSELHAHSVELTSDGRFAWVSHWDAGTLLINLDEPARPAFAGAVRFTGDGEGNRHSSSIDEERSLLIVNEEDLHPSTTDDHAAGWGSQHIYDVGDTRSPTEIATIATQRSADGTGEVALDGFYSSHDTVLRGAVAISSWYSDGVRIVDLSDPTQPDELGVFVPPPSRDPVGYWVAPDGSTAFPMVWGVDVQDDLIFVSDMNSGLWIIRFNDGSHTEGEPGPDTG